jgi:hypothetical protein
MLRRVFVLPDITREEKTDVTEFTSIFRGG